MSTYFSGASDLKLGLFPRKLSLFFCRNWNTGKLQRSENCCYLWQHQKTIVFCNEALLHAKEHHSRNRESETGLCWSDAKEPNSLTDVFSTMQRSPSRLTMEFADGKDLWHVSWGTRSTGCRQGCELQTIKYKHARVLSTQMHSSSCWCCGDTSAGMTISN